jgi:carboxyl-terminal processing protease
MQALLSLGWFFEVLRLKFLMNTIINYMKRNYKILLALVLLSVTLFAFKMKSSNEADPDKDKLLLELTFVIEKGTTLP